MGAAFLRDSLDDALSSIEAAERSGRAPGHRDGANGQFLAEAGAGGSRLEFGADVPGGRGLPLSARIARVHPSSRRNCVLSWSPARRPRKGRHPRWPTWARSSPRPGERIVLVSCDLRRPRLGQFFDVEEQSGLTTVLLGQQTLEQALKQVDGL